MSKDAESDDVLQRQAVTDLGADVAKTDLLLDPNSTGSRPRRLNP